MRTYGVYLLNMLEHTCKRSDQGLCAHSVRHTRDTCKSYVSDLSCELMLCHSHYTSYCKRMKYNEHYSLCANKTLANVGKEPSKVRLYELKELGFDITKHTSPRYTEKYDSDDCDTDQEVVTGKRKRKQLQEDIIEQPREKKIKIQSAMDLKPEISLIYVDVLNLQRILEKNKSDPVTSNLVRLTIETIKSKLIIINNLIPTDH